MFDALLPFTLARPKSYPARPEAPPLAVVGLVVANAASSTKLIPSSICRFICPQRDLKPSGLSMEVSEVVEAQPFTVGQCDRHP
jgi:hypothetical protein